MKAKTLLRMKPRRRREGKTDYRKRLRLVKSGIERLVVRKTNRRIIAQLIKSKLGGDHTIMTITSDMLKKYGWKGSFKSTPAAYLTGLMLGKTAVEKGYEKAILDIGYLRSVRGSRLYAVVRGAIDAGLEIPVAEEMLPSDERILGKHIAEYYEKVSQTPVGFQFKASDPDFTRNLDKHVLEVKEKILGGGDG